MRLWPLVVALSMGCGGSGTPRATTVLTQEDALIFDDVVDFIGRPDMLGGDWGTEATYQFEKRVHTADLITVVRIPVLNTNTDPDGLRGYQLDVTVERVIRGNAPEDLVLPVREDERGFRTVRVNEERVMRESFVAFVKWYWDPELEDSRPRWHLSITSPELIDTVQSLLNRGPSQNASTGPQVDAAP